MRIRVDAGSDIRVAFADPGFGTGKGGVKTPTVAVTPPPPSGGYTPLPTPSSCGSMQFWGSAGSDILLPASADFLFDGPFTIEWWHKQIAPGSFPRVFAIGDYPSTPLGVSLEGAFYLWASGAHPLGGPGALDAWNHHAICRQSDNTVTHYLNGAYQGGFSQPGLIGSSTIPLRIGSELTQSTGNSFPGFITNFHVVKGYAKYMTSFSPPTSPIPATAGTVLLLWNENANTIAIDGSGSGRTVTVGNVGWSSQETPYA
jgi:hypothetical protein